MKSLFFSYYRVLILFVLFFASCTELSDTHFSAKTNELGELDSFIDKAPKKVKVSGDFNLGLEYSYKKYHDKFYAVSSLKSIFYSRYGRPIKQAKAKFQYTEKRELKAINLTNHLPCRKVEEIINWTHLDNQYSTKIDENILFFGGYNTIIYEYQDFDQIKRIQYLQNKAVKNNIERNFTYGDPIDNPGEFLVLLGIESIDKGQVHKMKSVYTSSKKHTNPFYINPHINPVLSDMFLDRNSNFSRPFFGLINFISPSAVFPEKQIFTLSEGKGKENNKGTITVEIEASKKIDFQDFPTEIRVSYLENKVGKEPSSYSYCVTIEY